MFIYIVRIQTVDHDLSIVRYTKKSSLPVTYYANLKFK